MITIVDYKMGNVGSIANMLKRAGVAAKLTSDRAEIEAADKLILPGVGAYDTGMANLAELGLIEPLRDKVVAKQTPVLGICLGMQLLFEGSEEGQRPGLGWLKGKCIKLAPADPALKVPHMGWNEAKPTRTDTLFADLADDAGYYFVHSYHVVCDDPADVLATTHHGIDFVSAVQRDHVLGTQFHPEKSHKHGLRLLTAFANL